MRVFQNASAFCLLFAMMMAGARPVGAALWCPAPPKTFAEQVKGADAVVLAEWISAKPQSPNSPKVTTLEIVSISKGPKSLFRIGGEIQLPVYRPAKEDTLFLLVGTRNRGMSWKLTSDFTVACFNYISNIPSDRILTTERLAFFATHLESADERIAADAYREFASVSYADLARFAPRMSRRRLRQWIDDPNIDQNRLGLYGQLLGMCGKSADSALLKRIILAKSNRIRLGIDGVMLGYLLLEGVEGLEFLEATKLHNKDPSFAEVYCAMQAIRVLKRSAPQKIAGSRLCETMRILLERPEFADLVIADLARWKDWNIQNRLMDMYATEKFGDPSIKRAIVRFMLCCADDFAPGTPKALMPSHVVIATENLAYLEQTDAKTFRRAKLFHLPK